MREKILSTVMVIALVVGASADVTAEPAAEDAFKYRQSIMTAMKGHVGAVSMMVRGLAGDPGHLSQHAAALSALGAELRSVFQEGSMVEDSDALPVIWQEPEEFAKALARAEAATAALGDAAATGDMQQIGAAFHKVGQACKGCHEHFRAEHD
jgi:cytochrome c556